MKKITLLVGLPGSGKTTWLNNNALASAALDDISQTDPNLGKLIKLLNDDKIDEIWISDVNFCNVNILKTALNKIQSFTKDDLSLNFIIFPKDKKDCISNVRYRNDGRWVEPSIDRFYPLINECFTWIKEHFPYTIGSKDFKLSNSIKPF